MQNGECESPRYPFPPIGSRQTLARILNCSLEELDDVEGAADELYYKVRRIKKDGTPRLCYKAKPKLRPIHSRIKYLILRMVEYPSYLNGGLPERDYIQNARAHAGARVIANEDISSFFPSTSSLVVFDIWRHFFHFPGEVARSLTRLTTRKGELPQGASTSSYLSNLAFWSTEPGMVAGLRSKGFEYTRYIDDVTVSSTVDRSPTELQEAFTLLTSMIRRHGLRLKRSKHQLRYAGQRMESTGLIVGAHGTGLSHEKRSNIRALVHKCEILAKVDPAAAGLQAMKRRAVSLAGQYARIHHGQGERLKARLKALP